LSKSRKCRPFARFRPLLPMLSSLRIGDDPLGIGAGAPTRWALFVQGCASYKGPELTWPNGFTPRLSEHGRSNRRRVTWNRLHRARRAPCCVDGARPFAKSVMWLLPDCSCPSIRNRVRLWKGIGLLRCQVTSVCGAVRGALGPERPDQLQPLVKAFSELTRAAV
jgi:hypothetical protein